MKKMYHVSLSFKWFDLWVGVFIDQPGHSVYICLLPMVVMKLWFTEHKICPICEGPMDKTAFDSGDGLGLEWQCSECDYYTEGGIDWPFGSELLSSGDLERRGYRVI